VAEPRLEVEETSGRLSLNDSRDDVHGGFQSRDIPVGVVVLDSPWETNYNTFVPNDARYPRFSQMVADMHAKGVRVVLWTTQMVNESSFDLEPGGGQLGFQRLVGAL